MLKDIKYTKYISMLLVMGLVVGCNAVKNANNKQKGAVIGSAGGAVIGGALTGNVFGMASPESDKSLTGGAIGGAFQDQGI